MDAIFVDCRFQKADFYWANTFRSKFIRCTLEDVDFRGANMDKTIFLDCTLIRCDFKRDNLGAITDISGVKFVESSQQECHYEYPENKE
ncbi:MAG: pentapeptide repeat-containing protein [Thermosynechococcaceae cyanobacterium MS004]|nr:pentapeptide repeat-containing protein [Thermosynechococcaceae cyanobacterium MS004]